LLYIGAAFFFTIKTAPERLSQKLETHKSMAVQEQAPYQQQD